MIVHVIEFSNQRLEFPTLELANQYKIDNKIDAVVFDFEKPQFSENTNALVPDVISRMALKIQLLLFGIEIEEIIETINSIPSYMFPDVAKKIAIIKLNEAAYFDRYNADLQLVATLMGLSQEDLDKIFIDGNQII